MSPLAHLRRVAKRAHDRGASAVEYGLMVAAIAAVIVGTVFALGGFVKEAFTHTCNTIATEGKLTSDPGCPPETPAPATSPAAAAGGGA